MNTSKENIIPLPSLPCPAEKLLPHQPPMLLIDSLIERKGDKAAATANIDESSICHNEGRGVLPEYLIEIMAQTMAAANGYDGLLSNIPPKDGFIVGLDKFHLKNLAQIGGEMIIRVVKTMEFGAMKIMEGEVFIGSTSIASVELKVWEPPSNEE